MKSIIMFLISTTLFANTIVVYKSERRLEVLDNSGNIIKQYKVMLGLNPVGAKSEEGDNKTPEGQYLIDQVNNKSKYHLAFHISYPTAKQKFGAKIRGKNPGGDIMIHGYPNSLSEIDYFLRPLNLHLQPEDQVRSVLSTYDWTNGCIAVSNEDIVEIGTLISIPTSITIKP